MASQETVRLLEVEPDIGRFLRAEEKEEARGLAVPVRELPPKQALDLDSMLAEANAFAAVVLEGMLLRNLRVWEHTALRLLGPGDIVTRASAPDSMLVAEFGSRVAAPTKLAMLGTEVLVATHRWPRIAAGLNARIGEQSERVTIQLAICQLPRVEQRVLALMWLLAESWGRVTAAGTTLPLALTHDTLGALIGARRPTVTLALGELTERGAIVRQDRGWLLVEPPPQDGGESEPVDDPELLEYAPSDWASAAEQEEFLVQSHAALRDIVNRLREEHLHQAEQFRRRLRRVATSRKQASEDRKRVAREALRRRRAPSS